MTKVEATRKAIFEAGGRTRLARLLARDIDDGTTKDQFLWRIQRWYYNGIPPKFIIPVEKISGISRHDLDPDIYPREGDDAMV